MRDTEYCSFHPPSDFWPQLSHASNQVTGIFLESGSPEEQAAAQKLAREQPDAASVADLESKGISFAMSRM